MTITSLFLAALRNAALMDKPTPMFRLLRTTLAPLAFATLLV